MTRYLFRHEAPKDTRFVATAFEHMTGEPITVPIMGQVRHGHIVTAEVIDDGRAVNIEFEADLNCRCGVSS